MKAAALSLALVLKGELDAPLPELPAQAAAGGSGDGASSSSAAAAGASGSSSAGEVEAALRARVGHLTRVNETLLAVLFDARRHSCHLLVLNYWVLLRGLESLAARFADAVDALWAAQALVSDAAEGGDVAMADAGAPLAGVAGHAAAVAAAAAAPPAPGSVPTPSALATKPLKLLVESLLQRQLSAFAQLANAQLLFNSPQATAMLTAALPNYSGAPLVAPLPSPAAFSTELQQRVLAAVLPLWSHPAAGSCSPAVLDSLLAVITPCAEGTGVAAALLRHSARGGAAAGRPQPDAALVQTIVEMGFTTVGVGGGRWVGRGGGPLLGAAFSLLDHTWLHPPPPFQKLHSPAHGMHALSARTFARRRAPRRRCAAWAPTASSWPWSG